MGTRAEPDPVRLGPEHLSLLRHCQRPATVADLASDLDLAVGVVQVLVADLRERGLVSVRNPVPPARLKNGFLFVVSAKRSPKICKWPNISFLISL